MKFLSLLGALGLSFLLTSGCATPGKFKANTDALIGMTEADVVMSMGPPAQVYESPSKERYLTYTRSSQMPIAGVAPTYTAQTVGGMTKINAIGGSKGSTINLSCKVVFLLKDDKVVSWKSSGNDCVSF